MAIALALYFEEEKVFLYCKAKKKRMRLRVIQTRAALCCSVACWNANRGICPLHLLCLLSRCQELTDKASVTALVTFTVILTGIIDQVLWITYLISLHTFPNSLHSRCDEVTKTEDSI